MKLKKFLAVLLVFAMTMSMLTACGKKTDTGKISTGNDTTSTDSTSNEDTGKEDTSKEDTSTDTTSDAGSATVNERALYMGTPDANAITINLASEPADLCTITTTDTVSFTVIRHVIENLVSLDANDQVAPGVAESWDVSEDGLNYTFHLRNNMKWSNGEPVTAKDFVFAWTALLDPNYAAEYAYFGYVFKNGMKFNNGEVGADQLGFKAVDDYTLEVTLENPTPYFLSTLAFGVLAPMNEKAYKEYGTAYATDADKIVTNGPFLMSSWEHENKIVLTKNPDYYDAAKINLETINMVMINDSNAVLNSLKAGELDVGGLLGDQVKMLEGEGFPTFTYDDGSCFYLEYNLTDPYLANANLRTALTYAIDKQAFVDSVMKNSSLPATGFTPPGINGLEKKFAEEVGATVPVVDVAKANEYLDKALSELGVTKDQLKFTMISDDGDLPIKIASFVQEQLRANLGIEIQVESMPFKSRLDRMTNKDFSIVFAGWGPDYNDPMTFLDMFETGNGNNHTSYSNPAYDELLNKVRVTLDPKERFGYLMDLEKLLMTDLPIGPVYWRNRDYFISGKIESGVIRTAFQDMNYRYVKLVK
jgi:oligopeptide transport system substrate-binding protein